MAVDLQPGDVVWYVDLGEWGPMRAIVREVLDDRVCVLNRYDNLRWLEVHRLFRDRESARADGLALIRRAVEGLRARIAEHREQLWEELEMLDEWGQHGR